MKQGKEQEMFNKLAKKYNAPNPLGISSEVTASPSPFGKATSATSVSTSSTLGFGQSGNFGNASNSLGPTAFGQSTSAPSTTPFGKSSSSTSAASFGQSSTSIASKSSPFGQPSTATPFGQTPASTPFGQQSIQASTPFGTTSQGSAQPKFGDKTAREILVSFYQQHNPAQLGKVDQLLQKYVGNEEKMLRNLAKKYNMDPSAFGLTNTPVPPPASSFGSTTPPSFGQTSGFGASLSSSTPFGQSSGFGDTKTQSASPFGSTNTGGFGSFAQSNQSGGFGSLANNSSASGFSNTNFSSQTNTPFGAPRR